jgi:hypothetical protein
VVICYRISTTFASASPLQIESLTKPRAIHPSNHIPNLETCILNPHRHPVLRPSASEGQQVPTGLQDTKHLLPYLDAGDVVIPPLAHERQAVWWITHDRIDAFIGERPQNLQTVPVI